MRAELFDKAQSMRLRRVAAQQRGLVVPWNAFSEYRPGHGQVVVLPLAIEILILRPRPADMIDDDIAAVLDRERVIAAPFVAIFVDADADVANGDVVRSIHHHRRKATGAAKHGRASCRERVCQYVYNSVVAVSIKKKKKKK